MVTPLDFGMGATPCILEKVGVGLLCEAAPIASAIGQRKEGTATACMADVMQGGGIVSVVPCQRCKSSKSGFQRQELDSNLNLERMGWKRGGIRSGKGATSFS